MKQADLLLINLFCPHTVGLKPNGVRAKPKIYSNA